MASGDCGSSTTYAGAAAAAPTPNGDSDSHQGADSISYFNGLMTEAAVLDNLTQRQPDFQHKTQLTRSLLSREMHRVWSNVSTHCQSSSTDQDTATTNTEQTEKEPPTLNNRAEALKPCRVEARVAVPQQAHPDYNFIGRILGPRGMSVKQMEHESGCKILVRGKGSVKDAEKERRLKDKQGWEHLTEPLHILITTDGDDATARLRVRHTADILTTLLTPVRNDEYKRHQLMQLAIINGTFRPTHNSYQSRFDNADDALYPSKADLPLYVIPRNRNDEK